MAFFEGFVAADAYHEFRDLETYVVTSDGIQFNLYIGAVKYGGNQYPLFFLPIEEHRGGKRSGLQAKAAQPTLYQPQGDRLCSAGASCWT